MPAALVGSLCSIAIVASAHLASPAFAQDRDGSYRFELTPVAGYRIGGRFEERSGDGRFDVGDSATHGVILDIAARTDGQWEVLYAHQNTNVEAQTSPLDVDIETLHFGGTYLFDGEETRPFLAFSAGFSRVDPHPSDLRSESFPSLSVGGGVQLLRHKRVGVRIEGRVFAALVDSDSDVFCRSGGSANFCAIRVDGTTFTQWEIRAGLVFRFAE